MTIQLQSDEHSDARLAMDGDGGGSLRRFKARIQKEGYDTLEGWKPKPGYCYAIVRAISARVNQNFDGWPSEELKKSAHLWPGKPCFVNHENHDPAKARGVVIASRYIENGNDKYIECVMEIDAQRFPKLAHEIRSGGIDSVSMGAEAGFTICSYCGNKAEDVPDFCDHVRYHKGDYLPRRNKKTGKTEQVLVYESCHKLSWFELSFVFDPADETAVASKVIMAAKKTADLGTCPPGKDCSVPDPNQQHVVGPSSSGSDAAGGGLGGAAGVGVGGGGKGSDSGGSPQAGDARYMPQTKPLYDQLMKDFPGADIGTYRVDDYHEHDHGAMDFMTTNAEQAAQVRQKAFDAGAPYVLWQQQQWNADGTTSPMENRGNATQNHYDHVHIGPIPGSAAAAPAAATGAPATAPSTATTTAPAATTVAPAQRAAGKFNADDFANAKAKGKKPWETDDDEDIREIEAMIFLSGPEASRPGKGDQDRYRRQDLDQVGGNVELDKYLDPDHGPFPVTKDDTYRVYSPNSGAYQDHQAPNEIRRAVDPSMTQVFDNASPEEQQFLDPIDLLSPYTPSEAQYQVPESQDPKYRTSDIRRTALKKVASLRARKLADGHRSPSDWLYDSNDQLLEQLENDQKIREYRDMYKKYPELKPTAARAEVMPADIAEASGHDALLDNEGSLWHNHPQHGWRYVTTNDQGAPSWGYDSRNRLPQEYEPYTVAHPGVTELLRNVREGSRRTAFGEVEAPYYGEHGEMSRVSARSARDDAIFEGAVLDLLQKGTESGDAERGRTASYEFCRESGTSGSGQTRSGEQESSPAFLSQDVRGGNVSRIREGSARRQAHLQGSVSELLSEGESQGSPGRRSAAAQASAGTDGSSRIAGRNQVRASEVGVRGNQDAAGPGGPQGRLDVRAQGRHGADARQASGSRGERPSQEQNPVGQPARESGTVDYGSTLRRAAAGHDRLDGQSSQGRRHRGSSANGYLNPDLRKYSFGETEAPSQVNTLREEGSAPEDDNNDFERYVDPPQQLQDPNLDQAAQIDREQAQDGMDPSMQGGVPGQADPMAQAAGSQQPQQQFMTLQIPIPPTAPQVPMQNFAARSISAGMLDYFDTYFGHRVADWRNAIEAGRGLTPEEYADYRRQAVNLQTLENHPGDSSTNRDPRKGRSTMARSTLASRTKVATSGRRQHFAEGPLADGGDQSRNDQGVKEDTFISQTPGAEAVDAPTDDTPNISNTENNLVARVQRGRDQLMRDAQALAAYRGRTAAEEATVVDPAVLTGPGAEALTGTEFVSANPNDGVVPTQPKDASLRAFQAFDRWLTAKTGKSSRYHKEATIKRAAAAFAKQSKTNPQALFPALGIVLREARKNEKTTTKGAKMRKRADEKLEVAAPDGRVDVEAPVEDTTDAEAQASQFSVEDFGNNAGDNVANPDLSTDQNWAPGEAKTSARVKTAGGLLAMRCAEGMIAAGLEPNDRERKYQLAAAFEGMNRGLIQDRVALLERFASVLESERRKVASGSYRGAARSPIPAGLGGGTRTASAPQRLAAHDPRNDSSLFL